MLIKSIFIYGIGVSFNGLLALITIPALSWFFSIEDLGRISIYQVTISIVVVLFSLGLDQSYVRYFHDDIEKNNLVKIVFLPGLFLLVTAVLFSIPFLKQISLFLFELQNSFIVMIFCISLFISYLERYFSVFIRMQERSLLYSLTKIISKVIILIFSSMVYFFKSLSNFNYLLFSQWAGLFISAIVMSFFLKKEVKSLFLSSFDFDKFRLLLSFGWPLTISSLALSSLNWLDKFMLKSYGALSDLGLYSVANSFAGIALLLQQFFSVLWLPVFYKWLSEGINITRVQNVSELVQLLAFILIPITGLVVKYLLIFVPIKYHSVEYYVLPCMISPLYLMISEVSGVGILITKKSKVLLYITMTIFLINATLNYLLIPVYGLGGAVSSFSIVSFIYLVIKTEASNLLWRKMPKLKLYCVSFVILITSLCFVFFGCESESLFVNIWLILIIFILALYSNLLYKLISYIKSYKSWS